FRFLWFILSCAPCDTSFPYPTLFRSAMAEGEVVAAHGRIPGGRFAVVGYGSLGGCELGFGSDLDLVFLYDADPEALSDGARPLEDRKSTRLNSSHVKISYAVFCLNNK